MSCVSRIPRWVEERHPDQRNSTVGWDRELADVSHVQFALDYSDASRNGAAMNVAIGLL